MNKFVLLLPLLVCSCSKGDERRLLDAESDFSCGAANVVQYQAWGANGLSKVCWNPESKKKDGSFFAAEGGTLFLKGSYQNGVESGRWTWFGKSGEITREEVRPPLQ